MKTSQFKNLFLSFLFCFLSIATFSQKHHHHHKPKKIILMIGDGMGISQIKAASATIPYSLNIMRCTNTALVNTSSANDDVTDSAAAGTAMATGSKTKNSAVGVDSAEMPLKSILKYSEEHGLATGLVVTSALTDATPASFVSNADNRNQLEKIASQFLQTDIDIFVGGGLDNFVKRSDSINYIDSLKANDYQVVMSLEELMTNKSDKIAGLLYPKSAPRMLEGRGDMLPMVTAKAIELLSKDEDGFFLMVEGSQIDYAGHDNNISYLVSELLDFDKAVGIALDYAREDGETLVIVVADHETGGLTLVESSTIPNKMEPKFSTTGHTASPVGLFAFGNGAKRFRGFIENTAIFDNMMDFYGFSK